MAAARDPRLADGTLLEGRSLRYWRDLRAWPVLQPLQAGNVPLLQVWGEEDAAVPPEAYRRFAQRLRQSPREAPWCSHRRAGADHGLQPTAPSGDGGDGVQ
jgi:pimeloyl-ACP methyl ester carboxylesterase